MHKPNPKGLVVSSLLMQGCQIRALRKPSPALQHWPAQGPRWGPPSPALPACPSQADSYLLQPKETAPPGALRRRQIPLLGSNSSSEESGSPSILDKDCKITELAASLAGLCFNQRSCFLIWCSWSVGSCETRPTVINYHERLVTPRPKLSYSQSDFLE